MMQNHLAGQFLAVAAEKKEAPLFFDKRDGRWQAVSYREVADEGARIGCQPCCIGVATRRQGDFMCRKQL